MIKRSILIENKASIHSKDLQLHIKTDARETTIPIEDIGFLLIDNSETYLSINAMNLMVDNNTAIIICGKNHLPNGMFLNLNSHHIQQEIFDKPHEYFNLEKIRKAAKIDRKVSIREVVEKIFGIIPKFKSKDELLEEEFDKFISIYPPEEDVNLRALKYFFKAYIVDQDIRKIIETKDFHALQTHPTLTISQFKAVANKYREVIPVYIKDYINLERFAA